jgi:hypothetical protein
VLRAFFEKDDNMYAGLGIILIIVGAIVAFGVEQAVEGFDLQAIGYILMVGGAISLLVAAIQGLGWMSRSRSRVQSERHVSPDGGHVVEETHTS